MHYTEKTKPRMGDPYWYEWSVGEQQIINMLNKDNNIEFAELQANVGLSLDDVVITHSDGSALCIQVKHTRAEDTLTFAVSSSTKGDDKFVRPALDIFWTKLKENLKQSRRIYKKS